MEAIQGQGEIKNQCQDYHHGKSQGEGQSQHPCKFQGQGEISRVQCEVKGQNLSQTQGKA